MSSLKDNPSIAPRTQFHDVLVWKIQFGTCCLGAHVGWVCFYHNVMCRQVACEGDILELWKLAVSILNKQLQTAESGWFCSLGVGHGVNSASP
jgi:hypothetical protein